MDPVYLAVFYHCVDGDGHVDSPLWVFVYTDPPDPTGANLTLTFDPPLPAAPTATIVVYTQIDRYNTIYRIEGIPEKLAYRMHITATDPTGAGRPDAHFTCLLSRRRLIRPGYGPAIQIINPPPPLGAKLATMQPNFIAYGYVDPTTAVMSSWVQDSSNPVNVYSGVAVNPPPQPYDWAFAYNITKFTNPCTLYVQGVSDGTSTATVQFNV